MDYSQIPPEQIRSAAQTLRNLSDNKLWADDAPLQLVFGLQVVQKLQKDITPRVIPLPHPVLPDAVDVCLINTEGVTKLAKGLKEVLSKVINIRKFAKNYKDREARVQFRDRFDLFLCDQRVNREQLLEACGSVFVGKRYPVPVPVRSTAELKRKINKLKSCALYFQNAGVSSLINVARLDLTDDEVVENVHTLLKAMQKFFPKGLVMSISMKTPDSVTLPIYNYAGPPPGEIPSLTVKRPARFTPTEEEKLLSLPLDALRDRALADDSFLFGSHLYGYSDDEEEHVHPGARSSIRLKRAAERAQKKKETGAAAGGEDIDMNEEDEGEVLDKDHVEEDEESGGEGYDSAE